MKKLLAIVLSLVMVVALAACGGTAQTATTAAAPAASEESKASAEDTTAAEATTVDKGSQEAGQESAFVDKIVISVQPVQSLTPFGTKNSTPGAYEVYEMLFECDAFTGEMLPVLADGDKGEFNGYDHKAGTGDYTVYLKKGIHDQAGNEVKASDVCFSYKYALENAETSGWQDLNNVEYDDDYTVVFKFAKEQNGVGQLVNIFARCFIVTEKSFNASASGLVTDMCGTGPYKFVNYVSGSQLTIEADDNYWNKGTDRQESQQNVGTIVYEFISESAQKVNGLNTGKLDIAQEVAADSIAPYQEGGQYADKFQVKSIQNKFVYNVTFNCSSNSLCGDINLRMAIVNAIDIDGLVMALGGTQTALPAYAVSYYNDYDYVDWASMDNYNTKKAVDPTVVKGYLDKSSYNGETLVLLTSGDGTPAEVIAAQLAAQGIKAEVKVLDFSSLNATVEDSTAWDMQFGMMAGDYNVTVWQHGFSYGNTADGNRTSQFIVDDEWEEMLNTCLTEEGHNSVNMEAWWQHAVDNAYTIGCYADNLNTVVPKNMSQLFYGDKLTILPGACTYTE